MRIALIGNAGSGKSTLGVRLATTHDLPLHELDRIQWAPDWRPVDAETYAAAHAELIAGERWVLDGPGRMNGLRDRLERATHVILCDLPLWQNYWLLAERQAAWRAGELALRPGGYDAPPPTRDLFETVWNFDRMYMPQWREAVSEAEAHTKVYRITDVDQLSDFSL